MKLFSRRKTARKTTELVRRDEYWHLARKVVPPTVTEGHDHLSLTDGTYMKLIVVGVPTFDTPGYARTIDPAYLDELLRTVKHRCFLSYSLAITPFEQAQANGALERAEFQNQLDQMRDRDKNPMGKAKNKTMFIATDIMEDQKKVHTQDAKQFDTSCIINIRAGSLAELNASYSQITNTLNSHLVGWTPAEGKMLEVYKCSQPWGSIAAVSRVDCTSWQVASLIPTKRLDSRTALSGIMFGVQKAENSGEVGKPIMIDLSALSVEHGLVFGPSGSGKTAGLMTVSMRALDQANYRVVYMTVKADAGTQFRNVPKHYRELGNVIDLGVGVGKSVINPLQIVYDKTMLEGTDEEYMGIFHGHKRCVNIFLDVYLKAGLSDNQESLLDQTLNEIYAKNGMITLSPERIVCHPETWNDGDNFPVMHELREMWADIMKSSKSSRTRESARSLYDRTGNLSKIGAHSYINQRTTADFSSDYIVIDLSGLRDKSLQDAMSSLIIELIGGRFNTDAERKTMLIIDEGVAFSNSSDRQSFITNAYTMGRAGKITVVMSFTDPGNIDKKFATMLQTNSTWSYIFGKGIDQSSVGYLKEFFHLDDMDTQELITSDIGEGLLVLGTQKIPIYNKITDQEMRVLKGTDTDDEKASPGSALMLLGDVAELVREHGFCMDDWIENPDPSQMRRLGYEPRLIQRVDASGKAKAWIQSDIITDDKVYNQTLDHYSSVIQIAGLLMCGGFSDVDVSHFDSEDVKAKFGGNTYSFEYERPGSHTEAQLTEKCRKLETTNSRCFFVCQNSYAKFVAKAVGGHNTYTRGATFKAAIDAVLSGNITDKTEETI